MYCTKCGTQNDDTAVQCIQCGEPASQHVLPQSAAPYASSYAYPQTPQVPSYLVPAILVTLFCCLPFGIVAIVYASRVNSKLAAGNVQGAIADSNTAKTWSIVALASGIVPVVIMLVAAIAIPNLMHSRIAANEASAVSNVRTINVAESSYSNSYPKVGFACRLEDLGGASGECGDATERRACLIDNVLASGQKHGYRFSLLSCDPQGYQVIAVPMIPGSSGQRAFCSDQTGVIKFYRNGSGEQCLESGTPLQ